MALHFPGSISRGRLEIIAGGLVRSWNKQMPEDWRYDLFDAQRQEFTVLSDGRRLYGRVHERGERLVSPLAHLAASPDDWHVCGAVTASGTPWGMDELPAGWAAKLLALDAQLLKPGTTVHFPEAAQ